MESVRGQALLARVIDYAGLFPPAARSMADAIAEYLAAGSGEASWMLGRFVLPATRLGEFADAFASVRPNATGWKLSAIVRDQSAADRSAVELFNTLSPNATVVDSVECKPESPDGVEWLADVFGRFEVFVEVPADVDTAGWMERLAAKGLRAKVRTGGLTAEAFPSADALLDFIEGSVRWGVPFKATAGLHHATRGTYPLTYAADAASAPMYGYLNVLLATAAFQHGLPRSLAAQLLLRSDAAALTIEDDAVQWGDVMIGHDTLRAARQQLLSFGSCSFDEPAEEFRRINDGSLSARR